MELKSPSRKLMVTLDHMFANLESLEQQLKLISLDDYEIKNSLRVVKMNLVQLRKKSTIIINNAFERYKRDAKRIREERP